MVFYDRSWYNRAGVERVMGFCEPNEYLEFMRQTPELERMLVRSGIRLYKYWFSVTSDEQRARFDSRETDPLKRWKLSPIDKASLDKWDDYTEAKEAMFFYTDTADAPWTIIKSNDKKRARLNCMRHFLASLDYPGKDAEVVGVPDPLIVGQGRARGAQGRSHPVAVPASGRAARAIVGGSGRGSAIWRCRGDAAAYRPRDITPVTAVPRPSVRRWLSVASRGWTGSSRTTATRRRDRRSP